MNTRKRQVPNVGVSLYSFEKTIKYHTQPVWYGLKELETIVSEVDQFTQSDAKNVYVDNTGRLVSRPALIEEKLTKEILPDDYKLKDIVYYNKYAVYVTVAPDNSYRITVDGSVNTTLTGITKYQLCSVGTYIICFNDIGAMVFDLSNDEKKWRSFEEYVEVPITKLTVGNQISTPANNQFTNSRKEHYVFTNTFQPILPTDKNGNVKVTTSYCSLSFELENVSVLTDYRTIRPLSQKLEDDDLFHVKNDIVIIARKDYFLISFDAGVTFSRKWYPEHKNFFNVTGIGDDGNSFFFVASDGVFCCDLGDFSWETIYIHADDKMTIPDNYIGFPGVCHFVTKDIFCFFLGVPTESNYPMTYTPILFHQIPNIAGGTPTNYNDRGKNFIGKLGCSDGLRYLFFNNNYVSEGTFYFLTKQNTTVKLFKDTIYDKNPDNTSQYLARESYSVFVTFQSEEYLLNGQTRPGGTLVSYSNYNSDRGFVIQSAIFSAIDLSWNENGDLFQKFVNEKQLNSYFTSTNFNIISIESTRRRVLGNNAGTDLPMSDGQHMFGSKNILIVKGYFRLTDVVGKEGYEDLNGSGWYKMTIQLEPEYNSSNQPIGSLICIFDIEKNTSIKDEDTLYELSGAYLCGKTVYDLYSVEKEYLPDELINIRDVHIVGDKYYTIADYEYKGELYTGGVYTNRLSDKDTAVIEILFKGDQIFNEVPNVVYSTNDTLYLGFGNTLKITSNTVQDNKLLLNLPKLKNNSFSEDINGIINISTKETAILFNNSIVLCTVVEDEALGLRYDYLPTKLSTGIRPGDSVVNALDGSYTIFPTKNGLAVLNYQAFMATTDQSLTYLSGTIKDRYNEFYKKGSSIKITQKRNNLYLSNGTGDILIFGLETQTWWYWKVPVKVEKIFTDHFDTWIIANNLCKFTEDHKLYKDFANTPREARIEWFLISQRINFKIPNYYKNIKQLVFTMSGEVDDDNSIVVQMQCYRKKLMTSEPEIIEFKVDGVNTFIKRFNYWRVNDIKYGLADDNSTNNPKRLQLNSMSIKYEIGEEVK